MPNISTSVDDFLLKSDQRFDFTIGSEKPVSLRTDPIETGPDISDDSEVCADSINKTGVRGKIEERSARRSTNCSTSFGTSSFISNTDFVGKVYKFKIKTNEMSKNFKSTFVKNDVILESISSCLHHEYKGHSTVTKEAGSKLNPECEFFVPTRSLEQASTSSSSSHSDYDVKPFDPKEFHENLLLFISASALAADKSTFNFYTDSRCTETA
ncbi:hypothetical protein R6Q57_016623 [Mikania cordata]